MWKLLFIAMLAPVIAWSQAQNADLRQAGETRKVPAHTPEWTNPAGGDPGVSESVMPDLQAIIVLCATEPASQDFKRQWTAFIRKHHKPDTDIDRLIDEVMSQAARHNNGKPPAHSNARSNRARTSASLDIRKMMHDVAMNAIRNMK